MTAQTSTRPQTLTYDKTIGMINNLATGRGFFNPFAAVTSKDGRIFVLGRRLPRIVICNYDEEFLGEFSFGEGDGDGQLKLPTGMAFDSEDRLYITDEGNHRVTIFSTDGEFLGKWGEQGSGDGQLNGPSGIAFDSHDKAYVVDQHNHRVQKFTRDGEYLLQWGGSGDGDGQFNLPWGVTVDSEDNVYVADWRNDRIQKFTTDGRFIAKFGESGDGDGQLSRPSTVVVDDDGYIYVADWGNERVEVLGPDGSFQDKQRGQATPSKWTEDFFKSNPDEAEPRERSNLTPDLPPRLSSAYSISSQSEPLFWGVSFVSLDSQGRLYATDSRRHRIQVYRRS